MNIFYKFHCKGVLFLITQCKSYFLREHNEKNIIFFLKIMFIHFIIPLYTSVSLDNMWEHVYPCISLVFVILFWGGHV